MSLSSFDFSCAGTCLGKSHDHAFPDDSIHVALRKHGSRKRSTTRDAAREYVPRAPHPLMNKQSNDVGASNEKFSTIPEGENGTIPEGDES